MLKFPLSIDAESEQMIDDDLGLILRSALGYAAAQSLELQENALQSMQMRSNFNSVLLMPLSNWSLIVSSATSRQ